MKVLKGKITGKGLRFGIVVSRFNEFVTGKLLEGALDALTRHEVKENDLEVVW
ncbi:6,7-dimethyl-8-ribityllumazine synthase, partial [Candidatus Aerophobetes bacterium]|nr:6,7-dimethyl-8-ribityllumazine synthase [Candidatus Aerophobetes bacterium]